MFSFKEYNISIIGLGLMGAAFADGLRDLQPKNLWGIEINKEIIHQAEKTGLIDKGYGQPDEILPQSDIVFICLYPEDSINFIKKYMKLFKSGCIITDIVGIKSKIVQEVNKELRDDVDFIPGHPMAGKEKQGFGYANKEIFTNKNYILTLTDRNKQENIKLIEYIIKTIGFSNIVKTDVENHDQKIAFTSQLCHVIAAALINCDNDEDIINYAGGSFRDLTRIAMINSEMWSELFLLNNNKLVDEITKFEKNIKIIKDHIQQGSKDNLKEVLDNVRKKRENMIRN